MFFEQMHPSWQAALTDAKPVLDALEAKLDQQPGNFVPPKTQVMKAFETPLDEVRVLLVGQDPYPTRGHAHGLCFSVEPDVRPFPKSLLNIFKEIQGDLGIPMPENGNLARWAEQGVLLLNSSLTVEEGKPDSHKGFGWEKFTDAVIQTINTEKTGVVFILWGAKAISKESYIDHSKHLILKSVHPSPLSAHRGFFGCKHFSKTNEFLRMMEQTEIQW